MKILVYGAGVLGSVYAAHLHRGGHAVEILARGRRLADIREHGVVLEELGTGGRLVTRVPAVERLEPTEAYDLVLVVVRKTQVDSVLPALADHEHTPSVTFLMNNAAGSDLLVQALGPDRVLMGFPLVGGVREGSVVRWASWEGGRRRLMTALGELDGSLTQRLRDIVEAFAQAGIGVAVQPDIDAWLKAHVALVSPIAQALRLSGNDNYRLAQERDLLRLMVRAQREGFRVVRALGLPLAPARLKLIAWLPIWVSVAVVRGILSSKRAEITLAGHAAAARDELRLLAEEFRVLIERASLPTPAIDELHRQS